MMKGLRITTKAIAGFREHLILEERSAATIQKYTRDIKAFAEYASEAITKGINTLPLKVRELKSLDIAGFFSAYFSTLPVFFLRTLPAELCKLFERTSRNISFGCPS